MDSYSPMDDEIRRQWTALVARLDVVPVRVAVWQGAPIVHTTLADVVLHPTAFDVAAHFEIVEAHA